MAQQVGLENILNAAFNTHTNNFYTAIPCIVLTVHGDLQDQRVDVQPCINRKTTEGDVTEHSPILHVPVMFPASSTSAFTFPINKNDTVWCMFSQRTMDMFKSGNGFPNDPNDFRRFDKRDAVAIPGLFPFQKAINNPKKRTYTHSTQDAVIAHNIGTSSEVEVRLKPNGDCIINSPKDVVVNAAGDAIINTEGKTEVNATGVVTVNSDVSATVTAPIGVMNCSTSFTLTSPTMTFNGNMILNGNFTMSSGGGYIGTFNGNLTTVGTITNNGVDISSTHKHTVSGIQTGGGSVESLVPH